MYTVRLTKLSTNENKLRTNVVEGTSPILPQVGETFEVYADPIESGFDFRYVVTSEVKTVVWAIPQKICNLETQYSNYKLEILAIVE